MVTMYKSKPRGFAINMSRVLVFGIGLVALTLVGITWRMSDSSDSQEIPFATDNRPPEAAPQCPWREPEKDLKQFFPSATRYETATRILSGRRLELAERLGHAPTSDENALRVYSVFGDQNPMGAVLTRRVKGEFGAIELVLAVNTNQEICGVRLQRLREPAPVADALQHTQWLHAFDGKSANSALKIGLDIPDVSADARNSAESIADGARSLLILLATSASETELVPHH